MVALMAAGAGWYFRDSLHQLWLKMGQPILVLGERKPRPDPERYEVLKEESARWRKVFGQRYRAAGVRASR